MNIGELKAQIAGLSEDTPFIIQVREEVELTSGEAYINSSYHEVDGVDFDPETGEVYAMSEVS